MCSVVWRQKGWLSPMHSHPFLSDSPPSSQTSGKILNWFIKIIILRIPLFHTLYRALNPSLHDHHVVFSEQLPIES